MFRMFPVSKFKCQQAEQDLGSFSEHELQRYLDLIWFRLNSFFKTNLRAAVIATIQVCTFKPEWERTTAF